MMQQMLLGYTTAASAPITYYTNNLVFNVDGSDSASVANLLAGGNQWITINGNLANTSNVTLTNCSYTSQYGGGVTFDGYNQWSIGEFTTPFTANSTHSWEVWTDGEWSTGWPGSPYTWVLHNNVNSQSTGDSYFTLGIDAGNYFFGALNGAYQSMYHTGYNSSNSTVHHLMFTWDNSQQRFYVNGTLGSVQSLGTNFSGNFGAFNTITTMGEAYGGNYRPLKGNIYSVRCWDVALSASDVLANFNGNKAKFGL
tara:strand:- start:411 stop:1172 length:762 start_codon:yes stop_codon:yes gene_type:complete